MSNIITDNTVKWKIIDHIDSVNGIFPKNNNIDLNIKFFNSLEQIGIVTGEETLLSIAQALPDNSILMYYPMSETGYADIYPHVSIVEASQWYGVLRVYKSNSVAVFDFSAQVLGEALFSRHWKMSISTSEVGAADVINKKWQEIQYKINRVEDLGLDRSTLTLKALANALPFGVTIELYASPTDSGNAGYPANVFPTNYGYFRATRANNSAVVLFEFYAIEKKSDNNFWTTGYYIASHSTGYTEQDIQWICVLSTVGTSIENISFKNISGSTNYYLRFSNKLVYVLQQNNFPANTTYVDITPIIPMERILCCDIINVEMTTTEKFSVTREYRWCVGKDTDIYTGLINDKIRIVSEKTTTGADTIMIRYWGYTKE